MYVICCVMLNLSIISGAQLYTYVYIYMYIHKHTHIYREICELASISFQSKHLTRKGGGRVATEAPDPRVVRHLDVTGGRVGGLGYRRSMTSCAMRFRRAQEAPESRVCACPTRWCQQCLERTEAIPSVWIRSRDPQPRR